MDNGITDDETNVDNLNTVFVLAHVNKPEVTGDCWWDVVVSPHACFRVFFLGASRASLCTLFVFFVWSRDQDGSSECPSPLSE